MLLITTKDRPIADNGDDEDNEDYAHDVQRNFVLKKVFLLW